MWTSHNYLGVIFDEKRDFKDNAENLTMSRGGVLGSVISKINTISQFKSEPTNNY